MLKSDKIFLLYMYIWQNGIIKMKKVVIFFFLKKIQKGLSEHRDINNMSLMKDKDQRIRIPQKYFKINKDFYGTWSGINIEKKLGIKNIHPWK